MRLLHKAFKTSKFWYNTLAFFGVYGTVSSSIGWVATHLHHHRYLGKDMDPHTPWTEKNKFKGWLRTFLPLWMNVPQVDAKLLIAMRHRCRTNGLCSCISGRQYRSTQRGPRFGCCLALTGSLLAFCFPYRLQFN